MTNAVAVVGLVYDTVDLQASDFRLFLEIERGLNEPVEVRGRDTLVPGRAGRIARARVADRLDIELRGFVFGAGANETAQRSDFAALRQIVRNLFDPRKMPVNLVATLENGTTATIAARPLPGILWQKVIPTHYRISVPLESVAPDWAIT